MLVQIVEAFWRAEAKEEYGGRFSVKPYWSAFADAWCWENGAALLSTELCSAHGKESMGQHVAGFAVRVGPAVMILGAHGDLDRDLGRCLEFRNEKGQTNRVGWRFLSDRLLAAKGGELRDKAVVFDSCGFCANGRQVQAFMKATGIGMVAGFRRDVEPFDSLLIEIALVNHVLFNWWDEDDGFRLGHLAQIRLTEELLGEPFVQKYSGLAAATGLRIWTQDAGQIREHEL